MKKTRLISASHIFQIFNLYSVFDMILNKFKAILYAQQVLSKVIFKDYAKISNRMFPFVKIALYLWQLEIIK